MERTCSIDYLGGPVHMVYLVWRMHRGRKRKVLADNVEFEYIYTDWAEAQKAAEQFKGYVALLHLFGDVTSVLK